MEKVYDAQGRLYGYVDGNVIYDNDDRVAGYADGSTIYDE
ncbi:MAG: hypothetical protein K0Q65_2421, partial [Clostridia bacterium]|nr:hypothetical protein [Clostridia bacterium]